MAYYEGQTMPLELAFGEDFDPTTASKLIVSFSHGGATFLEKDESEVTVTSDAVTVNLTQAESLAFPVGVVDVQINFIVSGLRVPTDIVTLNVDQNLHMEVIS